MQFECLICEISIERDLVCHNADGIPFCPRCYALFADWDFHVPGCACCEGEDGMQAMITMARQVACQSAQGKAS